MTEVAFYRSEGDRHIDDGVVVPGWAERPARMAGIMPAEIPTLRAPERVATVGAAVMTAGEAPAIIPDVVAMPIQPGPASETMGA